MSKHIIDTIPYSVITGNLVLVTCNHHVVTNHFWMVIGNLHLKSCILFGNIADKLLF